MVKIGNITINNKACLAPMAGISNPAYLKIVEEMGCAYAITELISAEAIVRNNKKTLEMLNGYENIKMPVALQLFGGNAITLSKAAKIVEEKGFSIIDINMGCPVPKVAVRSEAGSSLLKNPEKISEIVKSVVNAVKIPVTVKIRSGWDSEHINAKEVAKIIEEAGASAICVHPRTRSQGYSGNADWKIIKDVKESVSIPVIGNGDIKSCFDAKKMLDETNCDLVMVGRACLGNPWLIKEINEYLNNNNILEKPTYIDKINMALKHLEYLNNIKDDKVAVLEIRNHIAWYLRGLPNSSEIKNKIFKETRIFAIISILNEYKLYLNNLKEEENA